MVYQNTFEISTRSRGTTDRPRNPVAPVRKMVFGIGEKLTLPVPPAEWRG